jgi:hypothetical protein
LLACPAIRKALPDDTPAAEGMGPGKRAILAYYALPNGVHGLDDGSRHGTTVVDLLTMVEAALAKRETLR